MYMYVCVYVCIRMYVFFVTDVRAVVRWAVGAFWGARWWGLALYTNKA